jgi:hypothetical protein
MFDIILTPDVDEFSTNDLFTYNPHMCFGNIFSYFISSICHCSFPSLVFSYSVFKFSVLKILKINFFILIKTFIFYLPTIYYFSFIMYFIIYVRKVLSCSCLTLYSYFYIILDLVLFPYFLFRPFLFSLF